MSGQMFSDCGRLHVGFQMPPGKTRKDVLVYWKLIFSDVTENRRGRERWGEYFLLSHTDKISARCGRMSRCG